MLSCGVLLMWLWSPQERPDSHHAIAAIVCWTSGGSPPSQASASGGQPPGPEAAWRPSPPAAARCGAWPPGTPRGNMDKPY